MFESLAEIKMLVGASMSNLASSGSSSGASVIAQVEKTHSQLSECLVELSNAFETQLSAADVLAISNRVMEATNIMWGVAHGLSTHFAASAVENIVAAVDNCAQCLHELQKRIQTWLSAIGSC